MACIAIVLTAVGVVITATTRDQLIGQIDNRLQQANPVGGPVPALPQASAGGVVELPVPRGHDGDESSENDDDDEDADDDRHGAGDDDRGDGFRRERLSELYEGILTADGELITIYTPNIAGSDESVPEVSLGQLPDEGSALLTVDGGDDHGHYRVLIRPAPDGGAFVTGLSLHDVERTVSRLVWVQAVGLAAVLGVLGAVTWWVVRLGIRPVKQMTESASQIAAGDLTVRVPETNDATESGRLAVALNRMLSRIENAVDERARSEDRLRQFVADASHELRTPVTTIRGYAELYRMGGLSAGDDLDDAMRRTEAEALRMGRLVEDMLTLAKLDEQRPPATAVVDLGRLAEDAASDAAAVAPERSIEVEAESVTVEGDEDRLRQVVANVVGNALVHTPADASIVIRSREEGAEAVFEVEDDGPGMEPEVAERITERFYRADPSRSRHQGGSGLGLAIVDSVVASHGGTIEVDTRTGHGTRVRLTFPKSGSFAPGQDTGSFEP